MRREYGLINDLPMEDREEIRGGAQMEWKPSEKEEEYFARMEFERKKKLEEAKQDKLAKEEKEQLEKLHYMKCPKCGMDLIEIDYKGVRVDKCSGCEGVWLDAGELEAVAKLEKTAIDKLFSVFMKK
jgi:hypothetical protein